LKLAGTLFISVLLLPFSSYAEMPKADSTPTPKWSSAEELAEQALLGNADAQFTVGIGYAQQKDHEQAGDLFRKAAEQGHADAQYWLGQFLITGLGMPKDLEQGVSWTRKAADQGHADAQFAMGNAFYLGGGVSQDYAQAADWLRKAAEQGVDDAQRLLGSMHLLGKGVLQDYVEASKWLLKAAERGNAKAQAMLSSMYFEGEGVSKDLVLAYAWMNICASKLADEKAIGARDMVSEKLTSAQLAEGQRISSKWKPGQRLRREAKQ
jgi:TPR repeat protein